jgi:hypothetical protein
MRMLPILAAALLAAAVCFPANVSAHRHCHGYCCCDDLLRGDDVEISMDDGCITFTDEETGETVLITEECELKVNDCGVRLDHDQQMLVERYYDCFSGLTEDAIDLAKDAAKVGVAGAKLGVCAMLGALKLLSPDYDSDDLQADLEIRGDKIERKAQRLEERGTRLERRAESLKSLHGKLRHEIRELDELEWF